MPALEMLTFPITVQLAHASSECREAGYTAPFGRQDASQLKAKSD